MKLDRVETALLPIYWAPFLINGDASGLEDGEEEVIETVLKNLRDWFGTRFLWAVDVSEETEFVYYPDHGVPYGGMFAEYTFHIMS